MTTYAFNHSEKGVIQYKDKKRYFWLGSIFLSLLPSLTIGLYFVTNHSITLLVPLVFGYVFVPIMDYCMGTDRTNPPEEVVPQLESDSYYQWLTFVSTPIHYFSLIASVWFVCTVPLSIEIFLLFTISVGLYSGLSINTAHELGHKTTKIERLLAKISLSVTGYGHFSVEHNAGHHRDVATQEDTSSSRMGESIYRFALREIPGAIVRGWQLEAQRLQRHGLPLLSHKNVILQSYAITFLI